MKKLSALILPALLWLVSVNTYADNLLQAIASCKAIDNDSRRLACFDAIQSPALERFAASENNQRMPQKPAVTGTEKARDKQAANISEQAQARRDEHKQTQPRSQVPADFGLPPKTVEEDIDELTATISQLSETARGKLLITLDNGTQWQQKDSQPMQLDPGMEVTIESGFLGAFFLSHDGVNRRIKVKRIR
ncbi:MAG: hypothetical protein GYB58_08895 [Gammaproteobacteria bacterium]|nr:hypothetical protein [Gammaproteobacteria bacterium]